MSYGQLLFRCNSLALAHRENTYPSGAGAATQQSGTLQRKISSRMPDCRTWSGVSVVTKADLGESGQE